MSKEPHSLRSSFGVKSAVFLLLLVFALSIAYKFVSSSIQENKEKAVIQERANVQQGPSAPARVTKKAVLPSKTTPITPFDCKIQSAVDSDQAWLRACYLQGSLTAACKEIFDVNGYYLSETGSVTEYQYFNDFDICRCRLPGDIAERLNEDATFADMQCNNVKPPPIKIYYSQ
ncbi:hypothetical protein EXS57_02430 [Candidatus Kaiserbacteria bacterium]|nr:hypothetical protein [Candidatus Kaiserbacteria bacterium]